MDTGRPAATLTPGQRLRDLRISKGMSQAKLAERARVSASTITDAELDKRVPTLLVQLGIAKALRVEPVDIWPDGPGPAPWNQEAKWNEAPGKAAAR